VGFYCCPATPFEFRIAEIQLFDDTGCKLALDPKRATASSYNTAWYNTPDSIRKTWPYLLKSGVKLNRIGQWGDKVDWATVEQVKGVYRVDPETDRAITDSVRAGVDILMTLGYGNDLYQKLTHVGDIGPTWRKGHPFQQSAPTRDEAVRGFARYCAFMAEHFRGRVKYFEIWNEENGWFADSAGGGDEARLVRLYGRTLAAAAKAIKQANPQAKVVFGGVAGSSIEYPRMALEEGAGPYVDVVAFHPYGRPTPESAPPAMLCVKEGRQSWQPTPPEIRTYEAEVAAIRRTVRRFNPAIDIWADEMNWFAPGEPPMISWGDQSELTQAKYLARFYSLNAWLGCGAVWWSLYNANYIQEWSVIRTWDLTPRASYYSAATAATALDDVTGASDVTVAAVGETPTDLMVKVYRRGGTTIVGVWRTCSARDDCRPVPVTLDIGASGVGYVSVIDSLYGVSQRAVARAGRNSGVLVPDLLVGDWPLFVQLSVR
jgi:hypothetical protein